jgi:hypothetical protein
VIVGLVGNLHSVDAVSERLAAQGFIQLKNVHEIGFFTQDNLVLTGIDYEHKANVLREKGALIIHIVRQGDESGDFGVAIHPDDAVVSANGSLEGLFSRVNIAISRRMGGVAA